MKSMNVSSQSALRINSMNYKRHVSMFHTPAPGLYWGRALHWQVYAGIFVVFRKILIFPRNIQSKALYVSKY